MTDMNDFAKNYLDLWQEQWSKAAMAPEWQTMMAENMTNMQQLFSKMPNPATTTYDNAADWSAPPAAPSDDSLAMLEQLGRRLAQLEERVAVLERK